MALRVAKSIYGLSPRVRGNPRGCCSTIVPPRSIPACTGEPRAAQSSRRACGVYPRVYGGTDGYGPLSTPPPGLSPRVRGNPQEPPCPASQDRSIPACTGEPHSAYTNPDSVPVYPRVYGGTLWSALAWTGDYGLSPRVRGNRGERRGKSPSDRSIPACTGEPRASFAPLLNATVYPRVYGGTEDVRRADALITGLSPRVRGNHLLRRLQVGREGSIPACTGEPRRARSWR